MTGGLEGGFLGRRRSRTFVWRFENPVEKIWPILSDTDRFNEAAGLPKSDIEERPRADGGHGDRRDQQRLHQKPARADLERGQRRSERRAERAAGRAEQLRDHVDAGNRQRAEGHQPDALGHTGRVSPLRVGGV